MSAAAKWGCPEVWGQKGENREPELGLWGLSGVGQQVLSIRDSTAKLWQMDRRGDRGTLGTHKVPAAATWPRCPFPGSSSSLEPVPGGRNGLWEGERGLERRFRLWEPGAPRKQSRAVANLLPGQGEEQLGRRKCCFCLQGETSFLPDQRDNRFLFWLS